MKTISLSEIPGQVFPAGRWTRVITGEHGLPAENFMMGYVIIRPGGSVPAHAHENEEVYTILEGEGEMRVEQEVSELRAVTSVYIPPNRSHSLKNTGSKDMVMMFVYSPATVVDHWAQEQRGELT